MASQGVQEKHGGTIFVGLVVLHGVVLCVSVGCKSFLKNIYGGLGLGKYVRNSWSKRKRHCNIIQEGLLFLFLWLSAS
jgi:hypothetical protein